MKKYFMLVVVLAVTGVAYLFFHTPTPDAFSEAQNNVTTVTSSPGGALQNLVYANQQYHFSVQYPRNLRVQEYGGGGNALTVVFQDPATHEGFQVFVIPYDEPRITKQRFAMDEPSGQMVNPTNVMVDNTHATMFYSTSVSMGDTREVWFVNKGLLYEVTTYRQLDPWLSGIMATWKFIP